MKSNLQYDRLAEWLIRQMGNVDEVRLEEPEDLDFGHSAEMVALTLVSRRGGREHSQDVVVRLRPSEPGLLEPYDMRRQFDILKALESTAVRSPRSLWIEPSGEVLGRPFFVMERVAGEVYERHTPPESDEELLRRMCGSMVTQLAAVHLVDLEATGLSRLGEGHTFLDRELERWAGEMRRVQRGPLPAMERMLEQLRLQQPEPCERIALVHGDPKPGNFAFLDDEVSAVFDWELADVGDPLADIGYLEILWAMPVGITSKRSSLTVEEFVALYEECTGIRVRHRPWYRAMQVFKICVIQLIGSMLFDAGHWDDLRAIDMAHGIQRMVPMGLADLGVTDSPELGPVFPRRERQEEARKRLSVSPR
ncbi:phosphotransferase family protein [Frankia sp. CNm7]|uniref:Phosphotransferase family protein n=1 Tax=Frankia nepalensis TaxID=1836974 RepID=A0A937RFA9_9ACTN|nr:phosphotransferase family protein [Frankia nepalensis]MBL7498012.1 phosphotransferase family protein [Frankia nepalensis]MBL7509094.1 phosphotransferase family protein [Frankia nepalensis]MBL7516803.1 phosphotransferase family protein [Frankia nepalensis]MBL7627799.1 phosphotransferase family protein [Frankia nepalensis]